MKRMTVIAVVIVFILILNSCGKGDQSDSPLVGMPQEPQEMMEILEETCKDIYVQAVEAGTLGDMEVVKNMVTRLGEEGYTVIDQDSQVDMVNAQALKAFCEKVERKEPGNVMFLMALNQGGFVQFRMETEEGTVNVIADSLWWKQQEEKESERHNWSLVNIGTDSYEAHAFLRSDNGYLFFEKYYMPGFSGPYAHTAIRIEPLDEVCRELNRKYILPLGYRGNNLFLTDWDENDYGDVDFYDLYDRLCQMNHSNGIPCNRGTEPIGSKPAGQEKQEILIPEEEFETILRTHFTISRETLREKTKYQADRHAYRYQPRGVYDSQGSAEIPYPEVVSFQTREDSTIELTVNAVWPEQNLGTAFLHQVTIRPLPDGGFQYVSNQVIPSSQNTPMSWYTPRIWEEPSSHSPSAS